MAIDPSISLQVRPPVIPVPQIQTPLEQFARVLSLHNLMTQGQSGELGLKLTQLQLEQAQRAAQQQTALFKLLQGAQTPSPVAPTFPVAPAVAAPPPAQLPTQMMPGLAIGAGAPLSALMAQPPVQPTPLGGTVGQTAPAVTPAPVAAPAAAPVALGAAPVQDPFAGFPSTADLIRVGGPAGLAMAEEINKARKAHFENVEAANKAQQANAEALARIGAGIHDEPSKVAGLKQALDEKRITPEVYQTLLSHPYNKAEYDLFGTEALTQMQRNEEIRAQINQKAKEAQDTHEAAMRPYLLQKAKAEATEAGAKAKTATYGSVAQDAALATNQDTWDKFLAGVPEPLRSNLPATFSPAAQQLTVSKLGETPNQQITTGETAKQHGLENVFKAVETKIAVQKNAREENIYQKTYGEGANEALVGVDPKLRTQVTREVSKLNDEYLKTQSTADQFQSLLELARSGNKAAGSNLPLVGVETVNAINGIKRINKDEIKQYGSAGSLYDRIVGGFEKLTVGKPIPESVLKDIETMHNTLRQNSESEYNAKLQGKNDTYKSSFPPVKSTRPSVAHVIELNGKHYRYKGAGATDDLGNYTEIK